MALGEGLTAHTVRVRSHNVAICPVSFFETSLLHILALFCFRSLFWGFWICNTWLCDAVISSGDTISELCPQPQILRHSKFKIKREAGNWFINSFVIYWVN